MSFNCHLIEPFDALQLLSKTQQKSLGHFIRICIENEDVNGSARFLPPSPVTTDSPPTFADDDDDGVEGSTLPLLDERCDAGAMESLLFLSNCC